MKTFSNNNELYTALVNETKTRTLAGHKPSRFEMLGVLTDEWGYQINFDTVRLVDRLFENDLVTE